MDSVFQTSTDQVIDESHEFSVSVLLHWSKTLRGSPPKAFLEKDTLKICGEFTGEHPCQRVISIKLLCTFFEITLWHGSSPVNLLHIFRTPFLKNTSGGLLLNPLQIGSHCPTESENKAFSNIIWSKDSWFTSLAQHKKWSFPLKVPSCKLRQHW